MAAYVIAERTDQWDPQVFAAYGPLAAASIAKFGGRYLAKGDRIGLLEGDDGSAPLAMAVLEFPSVEQARAWFASDDYQEAAAIRRGGAKNRFLLIEGEGQAERPSPARRPCLAETGPNVPTIKPTPAKRLPDTAKSETADRLPREYLALYCRYFVMKWLRN
jgi:uncharacterized protein (DUF1330 family)